MERMKGKKGWLAVEVGPEEEGEGCGIQKFMIPISHLRHPVFTDLLDRAEEIYGHCSSGPLRLPCTVDEFLRARWVVEHAPSPPHHLRRSSLAPCS